ncbi:MAG: hypothetical protein ACKOAG_05150, partial [Candidatus Kapaibacterium sp.]
MRFVDAAPGDVPTAGSALFVLLVVRDSDSDDVDDDGDGDSDSDFDCGADVGVRRSGSFIARDAIGAGTFAASAVVGRFRASTVGVCPGCACAGLDCVDDSSDVCDDDGLDEPDFDDDIVPGLGLAWETVTEASGCEFAVGTSRARSAKDVTGDVAGAT